MEEPGRLQPMGSQRVRQTERLHFHFQELAWASQVALVVKNPLTMQCRFDPCIGKIPWRSAWQPTPVLLPRESHGQRSLVGYSPWGRKEPDTTEVT